MRVGVLYWAPENTGDSGWVNTSKLAYEEVPESEYTNTSNVAKRTERFTRLKHVTGRIPAAVMRADNGVSQPCSIAELEAVREYHDATVEAHNKGVNTALARMREEAEKQHPGKS